MTASFFFTSDLIFFQAQDLYNLEVII